MKTKLQIRGVIVDSSYDCEEGSWLDGYISRGVITPESRVRMALDRAEEAGDEVEIEICSPGGSVFSGIELANRIAGYKGEITVTVGAFAASAAALIVLEAARAGRKVCSHRNSILLYHGAWSVTEGGRGAHADTARLLDQINEPMKSALKAFGVPDNKVERGFEEGRQLTMTAEDARGYGIVSEIIGEDAAAFAATKSDAEDLLSHGIGGLAAFAAEDFTAGSVLESGDTSATESAPSGKTTENQSNPADGAGVSHPETHMPESASGGSVLSTPDAGVSAAAGDTAAQIAALEASNRALQSAKDKEVAAVRNTLTAEIEDLRARLAAAASEHDAYAARMENQLSALHTELTEWKAKYEAEAAARAALVGAVNAPDTDDQPADWPSAIARFGASDALRLYPGLAADYRKLHGANRRR